MRLQPGNVQLRHSEILKKFRQVFEQWETMTLQEKTTAMENFVEMLKNYNVPAIHTIFQWLPEDISKHFVKRKQVLKYNKHCYSKMASARVKKALSEKIYVMEAIQATDEWKFKVRGQSDSIYDVSFKPTKFSCSCPDHVKRHTFCKHLLYLICRVGVQMEIGHKVAARSREWNEEKFQACNVAWALRLKHRIVSDSPTPSESSLDDACCPICYEDINPSEDTVHCESVCKNKFHRECINQWLTHATHSTCPLCRSEWSSGEQTEREHIVGELLPTMPEAGLGSIVPDILFTFDTTISMYPCLREVRRNIEAVAKRLFEEIPNLRIAIMAHGDYWHTENSYLTKHIDFTSNVEDVVQFVSQVERTNGGDFPEAYEYVLRESRKLNWRLDATMKSIVMIGDAPPHEKNENPEKIDWTEEAELLADRNIQIFSVQCLNHGNRAAFKFYSKIAEITNGYHLFLDQFSYVKDLVEAVCYRQYDVTQLEAFEREVQTRSGGLSDSVRLMFDTMLGRKTREEVADLMSPERFRSRYEAPRRITTSRTTASPTTEGIEELRPCPPTKFQVFDVSRTCGIKDFCNDMGIRFKVGRGFYEFTKPEVVSEKKDIVLMKKDTGELFEGDVARRIAGIPEGKAKVTPACLKDYRVFVQSTSANRKLIEGQGFLYEVMYE